MASIQGTQLTSSQIDKTAADDVNYTTLGDSFRDAIQAGMTAAKTNADDITTHQQEIQKVWDENNELAADNGDYLNQRVVKLAEEGSLQFQQLSKMYAKGEVDRNQYLTRKNNLLNSAKQLTTFINTYQDMKNKGIEAQALGSLNQSTGLTTGAQLNVYNQDKLGAAAQLKNHGFFLSDDGKIFFQKYDQNGNVSNNINDFKTMPGALNASVQEYQNIDLTKETKSVADAVKPIINVVGKGQIKTREDAFADPTVEKYIEESWTALGSDTEKIMSIVTQQGVTPPAGKSKWDFTEDPREAAADDSLILIRPDSKTGRFVAVQTGDDVSDFLSAGYTQAEIDGGIKSYTDAKDKARVVYDNQVAVQLGFKETYKAPIKAAKPSSEEIKAKGAAKKRYELANRMAKLYSGNKGEISSVEDELKGVLIEGESGENKKSFIEKVTRTDTGVTIRKRIVTKNDMGKDVIDYITSDYDFGDKSEYDFVRGISSLVSGTTMEEQDFRDLNKKYNYGLDQEGGMMPKNRAVTYDGEEFTSGQVFTSSGTTPDYDELNEVVFKDMEIKPDTKIVDEVDRDDIEVTINDVGSGFVQALTGKNIDFGGLQYEKGTGEEDSNNIANDYVKFNYQGVDYVVDIPIDYSGYNELQQGKAGGVKSLLRSLYESMRENRPLDLTQLQGQTGLAIKSTTAKPSQKAKKKLLTLQQWQAQNPGGKPADYKAWRAKQ